MSPNTVNLTRTRRGYLQVSCPSVWRPTGISSTINSGRRLFRAVTVPEPSHLSPGRAPLPRPHTTQPTPPTPAPPPLLPSPPICFVILEIQMGSCAAEAKRVFEEARPSSWPLCHMFVPRSSFVLIAYDWAAFSVFVAVMYCRVLVQCSFLRPTLSSPLPSITSPTTPRSESSL